MSKRFINNPNNVVPELMQGLSLDSARVTLVDPTSGHAIAIRSSLISGTHPRRISVVSGGGSGHEPMAAGYVGDGMLAGAVSGGLFSSPSVPAVSTLLDHVAPYSAGILVIVMNYQGDRLNFGSAVDDLRRRNPDYPIGTVTVRDDVALPASAEPRGIAGTIFVIKVAGAAADQGRPFQEVQNIAETAARSIATFGVALDPCTIPGHSVDTERLGTNQIELGMGIHNESGAERRRISEDTRQTFTTDLVAEMCHRVDTALQQKVEITPHCSSLAVMVNNLGAVSQAEMLIVNKCVDNFIFGAKAPIFNDTKPVHMFSGTFMTSFQMNGVSISCFMIPSDNGHMAQLLHAPTAVTAWNPGFALRPLRERAVLAVHGTDASAAVHHTSNPSQYSGSNIPAYSPSQYAAVYSSPQQYVGSPFNGSTVPRTATVGIGRSGLQARTEKYIIAVTTALQRQANELGNLDRKTGDGDMGDTVLRGCDRIRADLDVGAYATAAGNPPLLFKLISQSCSNMGGTIGSLTMTFLEAAAASFARQPQISREPKWRQAVVDATHAVMQFGGAQVGDRTLIDALKPAADILATPGRSLSEAARAARVGYESTKSMTRAKFGRSIHVRESALLNQPDPGAYAIVIIFDALVDAAFG